MKAKDLPFYNENNLVLLHYLVLWWLLLLLLLHQLRDCSQQVTVKIS